MIYILADEVRTGKTTALLEWIETWDEVRGILCPDGEDGKRYLMDLESRQHFPLEVDEPTEPDEKTISVGRFHFARPSFELANYLLMKAFEEKEYEFLVLDELGSLELENEGIHNAADFIFKNYTPSEDQHIMTVVRTSLVKDIIQKYNIRDFTIVSKEFLLDV